MKQSQLIGLREFIAIGTIIVAMKITDDTPVFYFKALANSAWMAPIVSSFIVSLLIYMMLKSLDMYEGKNLIDMQNEVFGKYIGWLILFYLWLNLFSKLLLSTAIYTDLISTMYFTNTPLIAIYSFIVAIGILGGMAGISAIGSTAWTIVLFLKFALLTALLITFGHGQLNFLFPLFGYGEWEVIKVSIGDIILYDDYLYFGILATMLPSKKDFHKGMWIIFIIVMLEFTTAMIAFLSVFDYRSVQLISYPWHEVIRYISLGFLQNVETLFFPFWLIGMAIRFAAYFYLCAYMFGRLFKIELFHLLIPILGVLVIFAGLIPSQPAFNLPQIKADFIRLLSIPTALLTIITFTIAKVRTRRRKRHAN